MKLKTAKEALYALVSILAAVFVTYLPVVAMGCFDVPALICFGAAFMIAVLCGAGVTGFLHKKGFRLFAYTAILVFLDILHIILACNSVAATNLVDKLTGYYNLEATAFYLLFAILFLTGFSVGSGVGYFTWRYRKRTGIGQA